MGPTLFIRCYLVVECLSPTHQTQLGSVYWFPSTYHWWHNKTLIIPQNTHGVGAYGCVCTNVSQSHPNWLSAATIGSGSKSSIEPFDGKTRSTQFEVTSTNRTFTNYLPIKTKLPSFIPTWAINALFNSCRMNRCVQRWRRHVLSVWSKLVVLITPTLKRGS